MTNLALNWPVYQGVNMEPDRIGAVAGLMAQKRMRGERIGMAERLANQHGKAIAARVWRRSQMMRRAAGLHRQANTSPIKVITICQPYAELIACGNKVVENRTWPTRHRGLIAIHAGKTRKWLSIDPSGERDEDYDIAIRDLSFGAIVATARLVDCLDIDAIRRGDHEVRYPGLRRHDHTGGPVCWVLEDIARIEPIQAKGAQGLWSWAPEQARAA